MKWIPFFQFLSIMVIFVLSMRWIHYSRWKEITPIIVLSTTAALGIAHIRHLTFFLIAAGAYLAPLAQKYFAGNQFYEKFRPIWTLIGGKGGKICFLGVMAALIFYLFPKSLSLEIPGLPVPGKRYYYPVGAIEYIHRNNISGNILTDFDWGEYIIWTSYSRLRVALDGRYETVYPDLIVQEYFDFYYGRDETFLDKYSHQLALLKPDTEGLKIIRKRREWEKLYSDSGSILYRHRTIVPYQRQGG
jgi:hypothetical protein